MTRTAQFIAAALAIGLTASSVFAYSFYVGQAADAAVAQTEVPGAEASRRTLGEAEGRSLRRSAELLLQRVAGQFVTRPTESTQTSPGSPASPEPAATPGAPGQPPAPDRVAQTPTERTPSPAVSPTPAATPEPVGPIRIAVTQVPTPAGTPTADPAPQTAFVPTSGTQPAASPGPTATAVPTRAPQSVFSRRVAWTGMCK